MEGSFLDNILNWLENLPLISRGAESELRLGRIGGIPTVFKFRRRKPYMDPALDVRLRRSRTVKEARILVRAWKSGVSVPRLLLFLPEVYLIGIEFLDGIKLKDYINENGCVEGVFSLVTDAGKIIGALHDSGISHGDPTTSNFIYLKNKLYIIDFGLSEITNNIEDLAVDLHLFNRAVLSSHPKCPAELYKAFIRGYREKRREKGEPVIERANLIELRGRYVEERRTVWRM